MVPTQIRTEPDSWKCGGTPVGQGDSPEPPGEAWAYKV